MSAPRSRMVGMSTTPPSTTVTSGRCTSEVGVGVAGLGRVEHERAGGQVLRRRAGRRPTPSAGRRRRSRARRAGRSRSSSGPVPPTSRRRASSFGRAARDEGQRVHRARPGEQSDQRGPDASRGTDDRDPAPMPPSRPSSWSSRTAAVYALPLVTPMSVRPRRLTPARGDGRGQRTQPDHAGAPGRRRGRPPGSRAPCPHRARLSRCRAPKGTITTLPTAPGPGRPARSRTAAAAAGAPRCPADPPARGPSGRQTRARSSAIRTRGWTRNANGALPSMRWLPRRRGAGPHRRWMGARPRAAARLLGVRGARARIRRRRVKTP